MVLDIALALVDFARQTQEICDCMYRDTRGTFQLFGALPSKGSQRIIFFSIINDFRHYPTLIPNRNKRKKFSVIHTRDRQLSVQFGLTFNLRSMNASNFNHIPLQQSYQKKGDTSCVYHCDSLYALQVRVIKKIIIKCATN